MGDFKFSQLQLCKLLHFVVWLGVICLEGAGFLNSPINYRSTRLHNPKDDNLYVSCTLCSLPYVVKVILIAHQYRNWQGHVFGVSFSIWFMYLFIYDLFLVGKNCYKLPNDLWTIEIEPISFPFRWATLLVKVVVLTV